MFIGRERQTPSRCLEEEHYTRHHSKPCHAFRNAFNRLCYPCLFIKIKKSVITMRIRVTTSINVRSNTIPSTPAQVEDDFPPPPPLKGASSITERARSKSPIPLLTCRNDMSSSRFMARQRPPKGSRLSAWLHGFSIVDNDRGRAAAHSRQISHTSTYCYSRTPRRRSRKRNHEFRPANSTRGLIDPDHPLISDTDQTPFPDPQEGDLQRPPSTHEPCELTALPEMGCSQYYVPQKRTKQLLKNRQEREYLPKFKASKIRNKVLGCLFFGTILTILLTTCMLFVQRIRI